MVERAAAARHHARVRDRRHRPRHALAAAGAAAGDPAEARGLELAVRILDELGHTDLRDNQDTLVDDCYFTLRAAGRPAVAARVYRAWLDEAVPLAWRAIVK